MFGIGIEVRGTNIIIINERILWIVKVDFRADGGRCENADDETGARQ